MNTEDRAHDSALAREWIAAAENEQVTRELVDLYEEVSHAIESRGPSCWASGRCCSFARFGHRLYATGLEAAWSIVNAASVDGALRLDQTALSLARSAGRCPFQSRNLCSIHAVRPSPCRVFFCDRDAEDWVIELGAFAHARIKRIHDTRGITYRYAEWRSLLQAFVDSGGPAR